MIIIFNKKINKSIYIDESLPQVDFAVNDWQEDNPHLIIKLQDINFSHHALTCEDCSAFQQSFGTETADWYVQYLGKIQRLDLSTLGKNHSENQLNWTMSYFFSGSTIKLNLDTDTIDSLREKLKIKEELEDYIGCQKIFDKIKAIESQ